MLKLFTTKSPVYDTERKHGCADEKFVYFDMAYVKNIIIDPMVPKVDTSMNTEPLGNLMSVNVFVDSSHS